MKKLITLSVLVSLSSFGATIPMTHDDQAKIENLLRRIPGTFDRAEDRGESQVKYSSFVSAPFTISCHAEYFQASPVPSNLKCSVEIKDDSNKVNNEYVLNITDKKVVDRLYKGIPEGKGTKKLYATERNGSVFRYVFTCTSESCKVTFSTLPLIH